MVRKAATPRRQLACLIAALALLFAACASSDGPSATQAPTTVSETTPDGSADAPQEPAASNETDAPAESAVDTSDEPPANEVFVSPIGEALGVAQDELAAAFDTYVRDAEELTRQCMADAGFDYAPTASGLNVAASRQFELEDSLTADEFTEQYGFGIATLFELNFQDQGVINFVNQQFGPPPSVERSPGEQAAYEMALNGETTQGLSAEEAQEQIFGSGVGNGALEGSCRDYGFSTAENPGAVYDGLFSLLGDEVESITDRFNNDDRIRAATAEWQTCMAAAGHSYEDRNEIRNDLEAQSDQLANQYLSSTQVLTALGEAQQAGFVSMNTEDRAAFLQEVGALQGFSWVPEVQAEVDQLIAFELQVAADSASCSDEDLFLEVQFELETEFVEEHAEQLALIAAGDI